VLGVRYGISVATGPKASVEWTAGVSSGCGQNSRVGGKNAPAACKSALPPRRTAACGDQLIHFLLHVRALFGVDQRAHFHAFLRRVAHHHFPGGQSAPAHGINLALRHDDAANGGTFLPGFGGHLADHFAG
jgi:hypothetical protein